MSFIALNTKRNQESNLPIYHIFYYFGLKTSTYYVPICCKIWSIIQSLICEETVLGGTQNQSHSECARKTEGSWPWIISIKCKAWFT